jgi:ubiquinone/menaquinone biosynthesis C-methylase UbiE
MLTRARRSGNLPYTSHMQEPEDLTAATYNAMAAHWAASNEAEIDFWEPELATFHTLLGAGHILEIGFGGGREARELTALGYEYTGVDSSEGLLGMARERYPHLRFLHGSVYHLPFDNDAFDGFWAAAVLLHLPKTRIGKALDELHRVTKHGGMGAIIMREGDGEGLREREKHGVRDVRYFANYTDDEFCAVLARHGFEVVQVQEHPQNDQYHWLSFFVRARKS